MADWEYSWVTCDIAHIQNGLLGVISIGEASIWWGETRLRVLWIWTRTKSVGKCGGIEFSVIPAQFPGTVHSQEVVEPLKKLVDPYAIIGVVITACYCNFSQYNSIIRNMMIIWRSTDLPQFVLNDLGRPQRLKSTRRGHFVDQNFGIAMGKGMILVAPWLMRMWCR